MRDRLEAAIAGENIAAVRSLLGCVENEYVELPSELTDRAKMSIALFDAMRSNSANKVNSLIDASDRLLLAKGSAMPIRRTCSYFLDIDDAMQAKDRDLVSLRNVYAQTIEACPDVPNRPLLYHAIYTADTKQLFAKGVDKAVKSMLLSDIEDALIYAKKHELERSVLYKKLTVCSLTILCTHLRTFTVLDVDHRGCLSISRTEST